MINRFLSGPGGEEHELCCDEAGVVVTLSAEQRDRTQDYTKQKTLEPPPSMIDPQQITQKGTLQYSLMPEAIWLSV